MPESVEDGGRAVAEGGAVAGARASEFVVAAPDADADEFVVGVEGELGVEGGAEVMESVPFLDGVSGGGGEAGVDDPGEVRAGPLLGRGFKERDNLGLREGEVEAVALAPALGVLHVGKEFGRGVRDEAEIVHKE